MTPIKANLLLSRLPEAERKVIEPLLRSVGLPLREPLFEPDQQPRYVHFLTSGMASIVTNMEDGTRSEGGIVGYEGMPESLHLLGPGLVPTSCFMQIEGTALRMRFADFKEIFLRLPAMRSQIFAFVQYQSFILGQVAACNRLHEVQARMARWLLMVDDRTHEEQLALTHEFLSQMLGTRRSTVTLVARSLQSRKIIDYGRGEVRIVDRAKLTKLACECYSIVGGLLMRFRELRTEPALVESTAGQRPMVRSRV